MSRTKSNFERMDISISPCTSTQCPEGTESPVKTICSKVISSYQSNERLTCVVTPENKESLHRIAFNRNSPFVRRNITFNPFNHNLKERLEKPILSPDLFSVVISPSQDMEEFKWTIDDLSKINPAHIEEEFHFEEPIDEKTESEMQNTIDKYFTKIHMVPSPWDQKLPTNWKSFHEVIKKCHAESSPEQQNMSIESSPYHISLSHLKLASKNPVLDVSTQTALSLPPDLPENINTALKPYFTQSNDDEINLSMNSLRRKLFFKTEDDDTSPVRCFTGKDLSPMINNCCPSTPVIIKRTDCSLIDKLSPLDISPISRFCDQKLCSNSSSTMQIDSSIIKSQNSDCSASSDNKQFIHTPSLLRFEECFKVFESPKITSGIRRNRKRRRSFTHDLDVSISYTSFAAKQSLKNSTRKQSCSINKNTNTLNENFIESQDTGYSTDVSNFHSNISDLKSVTFECWKRNNPDKENIIIASTPTK